MDGLKELSVSQPANFGMQLGEPLACQQLMGCAKEMRAHEYGQSSSRRMSPYCCPTSRHQPKILFSLLKAELDHANQPPPTWTSDRLDAGGDLFNTIGNSKKRSSGDDERCPMETDADCSAAGTNSRALMSNPSEIVPPDDRKLLAADRPRCKSIGSTGFVGVASTTEVSRTPSRDSLASYDSLSDEILSSNGGRNPADTASSEALLEVTRNRLMGLSTGDRVSPVDTTAATQSVSQPGTPPLASYMEPHRKYSEGSQRSHLRAKFTSMRSDRLRSELTPVDLSCKRTKYSTDLNDPKASGRKKYDSLSLSSSSSDDSDESILKSVLTGRGRAHTFSVGVGNGCRGTAMVTPDMALGPPSRYAPRQRVVLAKKNLLPVSAQILDRLNRIHKFATSLPEFTVLPFTDQTSLLVSAYPRLLLLYMAESNLQFAVAAVNDDDQQVTENGSSVEVPTMQFATGIQNFIHKCQTVNITSNEYFYMRLITLFYAGKCCFDII